jgi:hypothetical protein
MRTSLLRGWPGTTKKQQTHQTYIDRYRQPRAIPKNGYPARVEVSAVPVVRSSWSLKDVFPPHLQGLVAFGKMLQFCYFFVDHLLVSLWKKT